MSIPKEILEVPRPKNTLVTVYGKDKNKYAVRQRVGCRYENGRHLPVNGPTIGHIVDGKFVPKGDLSPIHFASVDIKEWANVILADRLFQEILEELLCVYCKKDAEKIYTIAILRVCHPGIKDSELMDAYKESFLSELYPEVALSKNTVSTFLNDLGKTFSRIIQFMQNRTAKVKMDHHLIVDGTLKADDSTVNTLSNFSRKAKLKESRDISILYAYDFEKKEPICSKCFSGNMLDATAYEAFLTENKIEKGIITGDKAFAESVTHEYYKAHPDLHYLNPLMHNRILIETYKMLEFTDILLGHEGVWCKKEKCTNTNKWLYSFKDIKKNEKSLGTIVFESDIDMPIETAYDVYDKRWEIEIAMRYYKSACEFDNTREYDDYSVIGSEFCDFLSTVLTFRLINEFDNAKLLEAHTYKKIMDFLFAAKKLRQSDKDWELIKVNPPIIEVLQKLNLVPTSNDLPKRKPGRPKGVKSKISNNK